MERMMFAAVAGAWLLVAMPTVAGIAGATADGTWDCRAMDGGAIGTVVVADKTYAFLTPDGTLGSYGKLFQVGIEETHLPNFVVLDGYLKDEIGVQGIGLTGPRGNEHDLTGELFLVLSITGANQPYCRRRTAPAA